MRFELFPAIDLKEGHVVRLRQGRMDEATVYDADPARAAARWAAAGARWIHVVDLDGALHGRPQNAAAVRAIVDAAGRAATGERASGQAVHGQAAPGVRVQLGGGLRSLEALEAALDLGISRAIIGTSALEGDLAARAVERFGPDRIAVSIDARGGLVATRGWVEVTEVRAVDLAVRMKDAGVQTIIYTDIATDGMLTGPNFAELEAMGRTGLDVIASGGISSLSDIRRLREVPGVVGAILGRALYTGAVDLTVALAACRETPGHA